MTDFERSSRENQAPSKAVVRVAFSASEALGAALKGFTRKGQDHRAIPLRTSRRVELRYSGGDSDGPRYSPDDRRWLGDAIERIQPISRHHLRLASYVLQRELTNGAIGLDFQLMPTAEEIQQLGVFADDRDGNPSPYVDVHAIIPPQDRVPKGSLLEEEALNDIKQLLAVNHPALHRPGQAPGAVPQSQRVYVHDAQVMSRIPNLRIVR